MGNEKFSHSGTPAWFYRAFSINTSKVSDGSDALLLIH